MKTMVLQKNSIHAGNLILVNARYPYQDGTSKRSLMPINDTEKNILLNRNVVKPLSKLMDEFDGWQQICAVSGWRSIKEQREIFNRSLQDSGSVFTNKFVALPDHSEHQTGLAIDFALKQDNIDFICPNFPYTGICQTFRKKAITFGFIERYPKNKENITGIAHEPWHFRYVGTPHAEIMEKHGFTLEEYIDFLKQYCYGEKYYSYYKKYLDICVSYLKAEKIADTRFEIDNNISYSVSGNNIDGYIITEWR